MARIQPLRMYFAIILQGGELCNRSIFPQEMRPRAWRQKA